MNIVSEITVEDTNSTTVSTEVVVPGAASTAGTSADVIVPGAASTAATAVEVIVPGAASTAAAVRSRA